MIHTKGLPLFFIALFVATIAFAFFFTGDKSINTYANNSTNLSYIAFGDSITATGSPSFPEVYKNYLGTDLGVPVNLTNLGVPGMVSSALLDKLQNDQNYRNSVKNAHLITVFIGFNDFAVASALYDQGRCYDAQFNSDCLTLIANNLNANLTNIIGQIKSLNANAVIVLSDLYNPYISHYVDNGTTGIFIPYMTQINNSIHSIAANNALAITNVYQTFNGANGSEDPVAKGYIVDDVHPSAQGIQIIANQFRALNTSVLSKDFDHDGFSNADEKRMTTDMLASCPQPGSGIDNAWPPDVANSDSINKVTTADILATVQKYMTSDPRYDFNGNGKVDIGDVRFEQEHYFQACPK